MAMTERKIRQIIKEEAGRALRGGRVIREGWDDEGEGSDGGEGHWDVGDSGYTFVGKPELQDAWYAFKEAVEGLEPFMRDEFEDTESGDMASVGEVAVHQVQVSLTER